MQSGPTTTGELRLYNEVDNVARKYGEGKGRGGGGGGENQQSCRRTYKYMQL